MRELRPLTPDLVPDLVGSCAPCTFWQTIPRNGAGESADPVALLADWVAEVTADWAPPGRVAYVDGASAGFVIIAPARWLPRLAAFPTAPSDRSTLILATVVTVENRPEHSGRGLRKALVQSAAKDALRAKARSLDVIAARPLAVGRHACVVEARVLERSGFHVERDHPVYPRLRMDLRTVVALRDDAAERLARALARVPGVRAAPKTHPDGATRARAARQP